MAAELVTLEDAAKQLGKTVDQVQDLVRKGDLPGVRTGSTWKIKQFEIERYAEDHGIRLGGSPVETPFGQGVTEEDDDHPVGEPSSSILVSEVELGGSQSPSSTVIGDDDVSGSRDSDLVLASDGDERRAGGSSSLRLATPPGDSGELRLAADSGLTLAPPAAKAQAQAQAYAPGSDLEPTDSDLEKMGGSDLELSGDSDLDLGGEVAAGAGESDLLLAGASDVGPGDTGRLDTRGKKSDLEFATEDLEVDLDDSGSALDLGDEELMLDGESALDDDVALAGDSGINLAKPSDSGIDLASADESGIALAAKGDSGFMLEDEDAMQLEGGSSADALELPEDVDVVSLEEDLADPDAATQLKSDEDFDLTPVQGAIEDESDSGSQVIALDTEALDADSPTQLAGMSPIEMEAVESVITEEPSDAGFAPIGAQPALAAGAEQQVHYPTHELPEAPYSVWQVGSLAVVALLLAFTGILMVDVVRNIWSFGEPYGASTSLMNAIVEALGI